MNNKTILITGGSSGIGLELAKHFLELDNTVIICAKSNEKLEGIKKKYPQIIIYQCDLVNENEIKNLYDWTVKKHPKIDILINNAGFRYQQKDINKENFLEKLDLEFKTNFVASVYLSELFLEDFKSKKDSSMIFITSGLIYAPKVDYPFYNATKSALHSYIKTLRYQSPTVNIVEVMMTLVDTPFHNNNAPKNAISPKDAVDELIKSLKSNKKEIRIGKVKLLYWVAKFFPNLAMKIINKGNK